jgi:hypothetical protein
MLIQLICADFPKTLFIFGDLVPRTGEQIEIDYEDESYTFEVTSVTYIAENLDPENKSKLGFLEIKVTADLVYSSRHDISFTQIKCHDGKFNKGCEDYAKGLPRPEDDEIEQTGWDCARELASIKDQYIKTSRNHLK